MSIIRKRIQINGYVGSYHFESSAKPSYLVVVYKKTFFQTKILFSYYMVFYLFRTIGLKEKHLGLPSVLKDCGDITINGYRFQKNIKSQSLKMQHIGFTL